MSTLSEFLNALNYHGFIVKEPREGVINRCSHTTSKNSSDKPCWFIYKNINGVIAGAYQDFRQSEVYYFPDKPSVEQRKELFSSLNADDDKSFMHHVWQAEFNTAESLTDHDYLTKKQIVVNDIKDLVKQKEGKLLIPVRDIRNKDIICGIQTIESDGTKKFRTGTRFKGSFVYLESEDNAEYIICEGFATGYSIWKSTGKAVMCALSAQNIVAVYQGLREQTQKHIIIACDNDEAGLSPRDKIKDANVSFKHPAGEKQDFNDVYCDHGAAGVKKYFSSQQYSNLLQFGVREFENNWLFDQYIEKGVTFLILGASNVGKSFLSVYLAMCAANNKAFYGQVPQNQGHVLYVCGEGFRGINNRVLALKKEYGMSDEKFIITTRSVMFLDSESVNQLVEDVKSLKNNEINLSMIFIDTLNANFGDGDENSVADATKFMNRIKLLHDIYPDVSIGIVHHTGHNNPDRGRGSSAFIGTVETQFVIKEGIRPKEVIMLCSKQRNAEKAAPVSGFISTNQSAGVFVESATENLSETNIKDLIDNTNKSIDSKNKGDQAAYMIKIAAAQNDNHQITLTEIINIFAILGVDKKHHSTYIKRLLTEHIIMATTEKNIYIVNVS